MFLLLFAELFLMDIIILKKQFHLAQLPLFAMFFQTNIVSGITYIQVKDTNSALAFMAANFYDNPSRKLKLVGITGTNGKTTIASLLYQLFKKAGYKVGLLSTVKIMVDESRIQSNTYNSRFVNHQLLFKPND